MAGCRIVNEGVSSAVDADMEGAAKDAFKDRRRY